MTNLKTRLIFVATAALLAIGTAGSASAAVTVGDPSTATPTAGCSKERLYYTMAPPFVVPSAGVVTQVTHYNDAPAVTISYAIKLLRTGPLRVVATTPLYAYTTGGFHSEPLRIPVAGGEFLGVWGDSHICGRASAFSSFYVDNVNDNPPVGNVAGASLGVAATQLAISIRVEPDADRDGYGDETQDACSTVASRQVAPCVCKVPNVKATTKAKAKAALVAAGCTLGKTSKKKIRKFTKKRKKNRVAKQSLKADTIQPFGTSVTITLYAKKKAKKK